MRICFGSTDCDALPLFQLDHETGRSVAMYLPAGQDR